MHFDFYGAVAGNMAAGWSVELDRRSNALIKRHGNILPAKDLAAGARVVNRKALRFAQRSSVKVITHNSPLKRGAFIAHAAKKRFSKVKLFRGFNGKFWMVTRDFVLHRTAKITQLIKNRRVRGEGGRLLRKRVYADKAFAINKSAYNRVAGKIKTVKVAAYGIIDLGFKTGVRSAARRLPKMLHDEMTTRFRKYQRKINP